jgi:hypothetical protein
VQGFAPLRRRTGVVRIEETVYQGHFDEPKSRNSMRLIPLGPLAVAMLSDRRGRARGSIDLGVSTCTGSTLDRRGLLSRQLKHAVKAVALGNVTWHLLRHSNATLHDSLRPHLGTGTGSAGSLITRDHARGVPAFAAGRPAGGSGEAGSPSIWTQAGPKFQLAKKCASRIWWCRRSYWSGR